MLVSNSKGGEYHSPCPGCAGEDRFISWPDDGEKGGAYRCRRCGKWGDAIQFLIDFEGLAFRDAKKRLGMPDDNWQPPPIKTHLTAQNTWTPEHKDYAADIIDLSLWLEHASKFVDLCHEELLGRQQALDWLARRGISLAAVKKWRLGIHVTSDFKNSYRPRSSWGLSGGINPKNGKPLKFVLPAGIVIPKFSEDGILRRVRIRLAKPDPNFPKKKYHTVVGSAMESFMTRAGAQAYAVVETDLDAIMLDDQAADLIGAISLGTVSAKPTVAAAKSLSDADIILNAIDFDEAGGPARIWWDENFKNSVRHPVPDGKDPGEAFDVGVDIRQWIWCRLPASLRIDTNGKIMSSCPAMAKKKEVVNTVPDKCPEEEANKKDQPTKQTTGKTPEAVARIARLLAGCPCYIMHSQDVLAVHERPGFDRAKHGPMKREISSLLFTDQVLDYLDRQRYGIITAGTIGSI